MLLHHFQPLPLDFSITQNPSQNQLFLKECWFFMKKFIFLPSWQFFYVSIWHLRMCPLSFEYFGTLSKTSRAKFLISFFVLKKKKSIFSTSMASKSSKSLQNPYKLSSIVVCRSTFWFVTPVETFLDRTIWSHKWIHQWNIVNGFNYYYEMFTMAILSNETHLNSSVFSSNFYLLSRISDELTDTSFMKFSR